ncbi:MAG: NAD(P)H-hydrate dehydratase [Gemmatimonadaceae bacterium]|nr:NAD(P)H-hydrate dehydratase [Gemmatimonadaceae bacterium]
MSRDRRPLPAVVTASEATALDAATIATLDGDSYALMRRAGLAAATRLDERERHATTSAAILIGPGNNGGDGWVIAHELRRRGWTVRVHAPLPPRTADAQRARDEAVADGPFDDASGDEPLVVDALFGTGVAGAPRAPYDESLRMLAASARAGARIAAIDVPSGLDATTGESHGAIAAHVTITFGAARRGQLVRRDLVGALELCDIGLVDADAAIPRLVTTPWALAQLPAIAPDAHKGVRGRLRILGGGAGMAGAAILAARGAHASGVGMVRCVVAESSIVPLQVAAPFATVEPWRADGLWPLEDDGWPHAMVIGPGLDGGASPESAAARTVRGEVARQLAAYRGPIVLDGGALSAFAGRADELATLLGGRPALCTPHAGEFARLMGHADAPRIDRWVDPQRLAERLGCTVLYKGVPTVIASPAGALLVAPYGTQALAMGGSGDVLAGIAGALLAQGLDPVRAGAVAAWAHGTAAHVATDHNGSWRGVTMDALLTHLARDTWHGGHDDGDDTWHAASLLASLPPVPTR